MIIPRDFEECVAGTATTEEEGGFACGLEIAIRDCTHIMDN